MNLRRVYLARRNPELTREAFRARWIEHHVLGRRFPELTHHYTRCDYCAVVGPDEYDAVGFLWLRGEESLHMRLRDADAAPTMHADEARVFSRPVFETALVARTHGPQGVGKARVIAFLRRRADLSRAGFDAALLAEPQAGRPETRGTVIGTPTLACDGIIEVAFDSLAEARRFDFQPPACAAPDPIVVRAESILAWTA